MLVELSKADLIRLVQSVPLPDMETCTRMQRDGILRFTGNQYNEQWQWNEQWLAALSENALLGVYLGLKKTAGIE